MGIYEAMKKKNSGISQEVLAAFENDLQDDAPGGLWGTCNDALSLAVEKHLTQEQRFQFFAQDGACRGMGQDEKRKTFAHDYAHLALDERIALFAETFGKEKPILNGDNTITLPFVCTHGYYKRVKDKDVVSLPPAVQSYFERCAGGRLHVLQKALGIKLKIKSVDISPLGEKLDNPVIFTFEIVG
jgi:hypothetical protein